MAKLAPLQIELTDDTLNAITGLAHSLSIVAESLEADRPDARVRDHDDLLADWAGVRETLETREARIEQLEQQLREALDETVVARDRIRELETGAGTPFMQANAQLRAENEQLASEREDWIQARKLNTRRVAVLENDNDVLRARIADLGERHDQQERELRIRTATIERLTNELGWPSPEGPF